MNTIYDGSFVLGQTSATNFVAGPGIKIDEPSAGTVRIGNDETVLFESPNATGTKLSDGIDLLEGKSNFDKIRLLYSLEPNQPMEYKDIPMYGANTGTNLVWATTLPYDNNTGASWCLEWKVICTATDTHIQSLKSIYWGKAECDGTNSNIGTWVQGSNTNVPTVLKIIGINRISGSNA